MRVLVVEDEDRVADFLVRALRAEGYACVRARDGGEGLHLALEGDFEMILLDLMLPSMDGRDVCQQLRARRVNTPVLMLTALADMDNMIRGLRLGADDYVTKPFQLDVLLARIEALGRRGGHGEAADSRICVDDLVFDRDAMQVFVRDTTIALTARELAILELLMSHSGKLFSRERILSNIWGIDQDPLTNVVDVYIGKLRKKLSGHEPVPRIETVRGLGYRLASATAPRPR